MELATLLCALSLVALMCFVCLSSPVRVSRGLVCFGRGVLRLSLVTFVCVPFVACVCVSWPAVCLVALCVALVSFVSSLGHCVLCVL